MKNLRIIATGEIREHVQNPEASQLVCSGKAEEIPGNVEVIQNRQPVIENRDPVRIKR